MTEVTCTPSISFERVEVLLAKGAGTGQRDADGFHAFSRTRCPTAVLDAGT